MENFFTNKQMKIIDLKRVDEESKLGYWSQTQVNETMITPENLAGKLGKFWGEMSRDESKG